MLKDFPKRVDFQLSISLDVPFGCLRHVARTAARVCITLLQGLLLVAWLTDEEPVKIKIGKLMARRFQEVCKWASQIGTFYDPFKYHHSAFIYY